jgi:hypothetical protein
MTELINPPTILDMSDDALIELLEGIRHRRSRIVVVARKTKQAIGRSQDIMLIAHLTKKSKQLDKALEVLDKSITKAESLISEVIALRIQLADATPDELAREIKDGMETE